MTTDTSERGLEDLIVADLTSEAGGWVEGTPKSYNRDHALDLLHLCSFLRETQPDVAEKLDLDSDSPTRQKFFARLQGQIEQHGIVHVLRKGIDHGPFRIDLFYGTPSPGNAKAAAQFAKNRFTITRQLRYSRDETALALDLCAFINGLPVATFELKNNLTKQTVEDAVDQYKRDRDSRELLFHFGRCMVHVALDDQEVRFCTELKNGKSWFLPFNRGWQDGAGNPPNPDGLKTDYLWKRFFSIPGLTDIIENYAQIVEVRDPRTGRTKREQIFPRYHQLDVVRALLSDVRKNGAGKRYLVEHSAGSGKSNSIAWLAHQLIGVKTGERPTFDSIIVVTDRILLDDQIKNTIKQFQQVGSVVGHAQASGDLRKMIESGKKIIITTVQKFPFVLQDIGSHHRQGRFAIVIDEAHSGQGGKTSGAVSAALSGSGGADEDDTMEDRINRLMESHKMLATASYFAFSATPKNKTLEIFGDEIPGDVPKRRPFHIYTMKQAIQERFILDVLKSYTTVDSYYRLVKTIQADPEFDIRRANKKLRYYVESDDHAIKAKAEIMVEHFHDQVDALKLIGGHARAMVVTSGIERAIHYHLAIRDALQTRKSPFKAIVAFSGEPEFRGEPVTEAKLNGFPSNKIAEKIQEEPYRFLICADKFQTGYDEPLLHTMYVDKPLSGVKAVQTLSRLNRAHPQKHDVFVLDFQNDTETIRKAFAPYYRTTILSDETDPNKLHDLKSELDGSQIYSQADIDTLVDLYLSSASRSKLDPILDACVATYKGLDEDGQVAFKSRAKAFLRTYGFLASILPYSNADWEKLSIFLDFLIPKLPAPKEDDLSRGILETIDMDSYRAEKRAAIKIALPDEDVEIGPVPTSATGHKIEPALDVLSNILKTFNDLFGNIEWTHRDRIERLITKDIPQQVAKDQAYQNAMHNNDEQNARIEHDKALARVMNAVMRDDTELFKQFSDNESFRRWLQETVFGQTYESQSGPQ